ncbi:hypothetical protein HS961_08705 [Comamonas piscis]|uniref:DUF333 domain-containing protein n=1 Tax=Comamonas piscis TaxID=1562974 RepID=A0A7G5EFY8_9BURK|nr:hypothetical protein [Comamonas piscis]QMV72913.1 hypothetical protein HS961_08705 [Comamonas piscis]WSO35694.1 hypothetical protein VUJ63_08730 [Comamonas piscis]
MSSPTLRHRLLCSTAVTAALWIATAQAYAATPAKPAPSKQAIEACQGKKAGDSVQLTLDDGKKAKATCRVLGKQLVAQRGATIGP